MQAKRMLKLEKLKAENDAMRGKLDAHREHFGLITFDFLRLHSLASFQLQLMISLMVSGEIIT